MRAMRLGLATMAVSLIAAAFGLAGQALAGGPVYFCFTTGSNPPYVTLAPNDPCAPLENHSVTNIQAYVPYSTVDAICAAPLWPDGSSAGIDCGYGTTGGAVNFGGSTVTVLPRIKAYSGNPTSAQFRGEYWY